MNIHSKIFKTKKKYIKVFSLLVVASVLIQVLFSSSLYASSINTYELSSLSNQQRASAGLSALSVNGQLSNAAYQKAYHMIANNYWGHFAPDGTSPWYFISANGYDYSTAGENLAKDFSTSAGVVTGWMNSPGHRANIMNSAFTEVGYAVVDGTLQGSPTTLVVAMYAKPAAVAQPAPAPTPAPTTSPTIQYTKSTTQSTSAPVQTNQIDQAQNIKTNETKTDSPKIVKSEPKLIKIIPCKINEVKNASFIEQVGNLFKGSFKTLTSIINFDQQTA